MNLTLLVVAKSPVPGRVKTRLAADLGNDLDGAAQLASAALLDTLAVCTAAFGADNCRLALDGALADAVDHQAISRAAAGWRVVPQASGDLAERLASAHEAIPGQVLQVGMDTPQLRTALLDQLIGRLRDHDAVLAPAADGGWWALGLRRGTDGGLLRGVPMSTPHTFDRTRQALRSGGLRVATGPALTDADHLTDALAIADSAPDTRFARSLRSLLPEQEAS